MTDKTPDVQTDLDELIGELAEEFSQRLRDGEKPDIEDYARRHPEAAEAIRQILPALEIMGAVPDPKAPSDSTDEDHQRGMIGEYRIIREAGRGGMGVVYEAEQLSLGRRVALKVLPFAAVLDERQIQRFRNEALAAAQLDHPHIVNVYGVGCERSVHFYAMRFVEGETLAAVIGHLRCEKQDNPVRQPGETSGREVVTPSEDDEAATTDTAPMAAFSTRRTSGNREFFRSATRIGIEIAQAIDHAHQQGVIHRDIKPANIILDGAGKSWVTDFGLARMDTGATMTMTGDLLGTLRYMSPEQAMAKRMVVDHRTDIYSLGVTLYELLTLQPAWPDEDRHELLRKIAFEEPAPLRKINRNVPEELETIVLKAIAKNPGERYETAQDLADDLVRFLRDEPIRAKRPGIIQRATKWSRRHSAGVLTATAVLFVATIGLAVSNLLINWEKNEKQQALVDRDNALNQAKSEQAMATAVKDLVLAAFTNADPYQQQAKDYKVRDLLDEFSQTLEGTLDEQPEVAADIHQVIGLAYRNLQQAEEGEEHLGKSVDLYRQVYGERDIRYARAALDYATQVVWNRDRNRNEKDKLGIPLLEKTVPLFAADGDQSRLFEAKSVLHQNSAWGGAPGNTQELFDELMALAEAMEIPPPKLGVVMHNHAAWLRVREQRLVESAQLARRAVDIHLQIDGPGHPETAAGYQQLGDCLREQDDFAGATLAYLRALEIFQRNFDEHSQITKIGNFIVQMLIRHGAKLPLEDSADRAAIPEMLNDELKRIVDASEIPHGAEDYQEAMKSFRHFIATSADGDFSIKQLAKMLVERGHAYEARNDYRAALADYEAGAQTDPTNHDAWYRQGWILQENFREYEKAIGFYDRSIAINPNQHGQYTMRGRCFHSLQRYAEAIGDFDRALELRPDQGWAWRSRGTTHFRLGNFEQALVDLSKGFELGDESSLSWPGVQNIAQCGDSTFIGGMLKLHAKGIEAAPDDAYRYRDRAHLHTALRNFDAARADLTRVAKLNPESEHLWPARAALFCAEERWEEAANSYREILTRDDTSFHFWYYLALLQAHLGDSEGYQETCRQMLAKFAAEKQTERRFAVGTSSLLPTALEDYDPAADVATSLVTEQPKDMHLQQNLGAILFRAGDAQQALSALAESARLRAAEGENSNRSAAYLWYLLAMTHHALGHEENAQAWLAKANEQAESELGDETSPPAWNRKLTLGLLRNEAEAELGSEQSDSPKLPKT